MSGVEPFDAVILAGGRARRLGGVDKPGLTVGGRSLAERVASAVPGARRLIVVGPERGIPGARHTREDPPGGGPVPALAAGLALVDAPWLALLAGDLPFLSADHVDALRAAAGSARGAVLTDDTGREQWLIGVWRTGVLGAAVAAYRGDSLRGLLAPLDPVRLAPAGRLAWFDCDTPEDVERARREHGRAG
ncbi:molybdenum cofactor guanylyltransferase [Rhizohabitans arisaemae]|uniref:molybdenum cofactor guanylyltransferase n=1 Tax=Rhizohabitans arisaemae TaxID=2720610 RepID=UPI0024B0F314|nr:molybdenum cofactor guanylyltransferase [Rhizohabitans arisaemae]